MDQKFDVIVIGSGLGGLTAASILAQTYAQKVLLLEKHYIIGGQTNEFHRGKFSWEVVMSSIGGISPLENGGKIIDLVTDKKIVWNQLPNIFQRFNYPDLTIDVSSDPAEYQSTLIKLFPHQADAIKQYFIDLVAANNEYLNYFNHIVTPQPVPPGSEFVFQTTKSYLDSHFTDERIIKILTTNWGDYGLPPEQSSFAGHAFASCQYFSGAYFPEGGSQQISAAVTQIIKAHGGQVLIGTEVTEIIIRGNQATGVKTRSTIGKEVEFYADKIISDAGAEVTFTKLLPATIANQERGEIVNSPHGLSAVILYLGLSENPTSLGIKGEDLWIIDSYQPYRANQATNDLLIGKVHNLRLSFPTLKHHIERPHTAVATILVDPEIFMQWRNRPPEYQNAKAAMMNGILDFIGKHVPGLTKIIEYKELGTPLTIEHFISKPRGELFGIPVTPARYTLQSLRPQTSIENLYLTGNDICAPGYYGALLGGAATAAKAMGE